MRIFERKLNMSSNIFTIILFRDKNSEVKCDRPPVAGNPTYRDIDKGFLDGKYAITNAQYAAFLNDKGVCSDGNYIYAAQDNFESSYPYGAAPAATGSATPRIAALHIGVATIPISLTASSVPRGLYSLVKVAWLNCAGTFFLWASVEAGRRRREKESVFCISNSFSC